MHVHFEQKKNPDCYVSVFIETAATVVEQWYTEGDNLTQQWLASKWLCKVTGVDFRIRIFLTSCNFGQQFSLLIWLMDGGLQQLYSLIFIGRQKLHGALTFWPFKISRNLHEIPILSQGVYFTWFYLVNYQYHVFNDWLFFARFGHVFKIGRCWYIFQMVSRAIFLLSKNGFWWSWSDESFGKKHKKNLTQYIFNI